MQFGDVFVSLRTLIACHRRITTIFVYTQPYSTILVSFIAFDVVRCFGYLTIPRCMFHEPVSTATVVHKHHHRQRKAEEEDYKEYHEAKFINIKSNVGMEYMTHLLRGAFESETVSLLFSILPGLWSYGFNDRLWITLQESRIIFFPFLSPLWMQHKVMQSKHYGSLRKWTAALCISSSSGRVLTPEFGAYIWYT